MQVLDQESQALREGAGTSMLRYRTSRSSTQRGLGGVGGGLTDRSLSSSLPNPLHLPLPLPLHLSVSLSLFPQASSEPLAHMVENPGPGNQRRLVAAQPPREIMNQSEFQPTAQEQSTMTNWVPLP